MQLDDQILSLENQMQKSTVSIPEQINYERILAKIALRIRQSLNLDEVLNTAVAEVRQFLQTDRVILYRFEPDWSGIVAVESVSPDWSHTLGTAIQDTCFTTETQVQPYKQGRVRAIEDIYTEDIAQCHVELLARFQVRANLVVPILQGEHLWGLLIAHHCSAPRRWQQREIDLLEQLATHMAIAIQQSELYLQAQTELINRQRVEAALQKAKNELEIKVAERTRELRTTNQLLRSEILERQQIEAALRVSEERYVLAVSGAKDGLWDWNLKTNEVYFSSRWKSMLGSQEQFENSPEAWFNLVHPEEIERFKVEISIHIEGLTPHFEGEYRMLHQDGTYRWMLSRGLAVRDPKGKAYRIAGCQTDVTQRKLAEQQLLHDAFHDALTDLPNRALFMDRLGHAVERVKRHENSVFAVLFVDLDRFKVINDSLGHISGDILLTTVAKRLEHCLRSGDTLARLGGDEFTILLEDIKDISDATDVAQRVQSSLTLPFSLRSHEVFITASIGIVLSTNGYEQLEDILRDADTAMYRAKAQGKACYQVFDKAMHLKAVTLLQLENDLRRAVMSLDSHGYERTASSLSSSPNGAVSTREPLEMTQDFQLHYQPIVSLTNGIIKGFEALVRWQHPVRGLVSPIEFIPIAEETGLIVPLGYWVLRSACCQMRVWQERFSTTSSLTISVNLSSKQFLQPDLIEQIDQILHETGLPACSLRLEVTESAIMENSETATTMLFQLRSMGIQIYIDDFGTGYSSLSYLQRFPVNALKIDQSFISRMGIDGEDSEIVRTIVMLAHKLGIDVVAEGVETAEQLAQLRGICGTQAQAQGYFFSKPLNSKAAETLIAGSPHW
jgi:diguanylate cyclase (GGDEF)-like protein/PAS domain S-box-containing protein